MNPSSDAVAALTVRLTGAFPAMMRKALDPFDDETIWWQPAPGVNPIAVQALHLAGNLKHFIGRYVGGSDYVRDRPAEFDVSRRLSKREVVAEFESAIAEVTSIVSGLEPDDYFKPSRDPEDRHRTVFDDFVNATVHLALHVGQSVQIAKLKGYDLGSAVWGDAHRESGAWSK